MNSKENLPTSSPYSTQLLTNVDFARLAEVPPEVELFADIDNAQTRRDYKMLCKIL